jgi:translation initiation factor eIF-2B subunit delta
MTFGFSSVVFELFKTAKARNMEFRVIVVDAKPKLEGKEMLKRLSKLGIPCSYVFTSAIPAIIKDVIFV